MSGKVSVGCTHDVESGLVFLDCTECGPLPLVETGKAWDEGCQHMITVHNVPAEMLGFEERP